MRNDKVGPEAVGVLDGRVLNVASLDALEHKQQVSDDVGFLEILELLGWFGINTNHNSSSVGGEGSLARSEAIESDELEVLDLLHFGRHDRLILLVSSAFHVLDDLSFLLPGHLDVVELGLFLSLLLGGAFVVGKLIRLDHGGHESLRNVVR